MGHDSCFNHSQPTLFSFLGVQLENPSGYAFKKTTVAAMGTHSSALPSRELG